MRRSFWTIALSVALAFGAGIGVSRAAQTNYLGAIFVADPTTPTRQMTINADGSINVACH